MDSTLQTSESTLLRLSRCHCLLGEMLGSAASRPITSHEIADELGVSEETVRHDLRNVRIEGRPGAGYDMAALFSALQEFLDLTASHPFIAVGNVDILRGLAITFPCETFGMRPTGYFSNRAEDVGGVVEGMSVEPLEALCERVGDTHVTLALVACEPDAADRVLTTLGEAGITGVVMLTPVIRPRHPAGMKVTYFRIPCALKSLASVPESEAEPCHAHA